jgi:hypothetical protein
MANLYWQPGMTMESIEKMAIEQAMEFYKGVKTQVAISLAMSIRTLDAKLEKYGLDKKTENERVRREKYERENHTRRARGLPTLAEQPKEFEDERLEREFTEGALQKENELRRQRGHAPLDPNTIEHDRFIVERTNERRAKARKLAESQRAEIERAAQSRDEKTKARLHVQSDQESSEEHAMPVPLGKEVQGVLPESGARSGQRARR